MTEATDKVTIRWKRNAIACNYDLGGHHKKGEKGKSIESSNVKKNKTKHCWLEYITQEREACHQGKDWWIGIQWHEKHLYKENFLKEI